MVKVYLMDGKGKTLELDSSTQAQELLNIICDKIGLKERDHFGLFETLQSMERTLGDKELIGDVLSRWESNSQSKEQFKIIFKKKIFLVPIDDLSDPIALDLVFHQVGGPLFE